MTVASTGRAWSVATRLSLMVLCLVTIVFVGFTWALYRGMVASVEREATERMRVEAQGIAAMVRMYSATVQAEADRFTNVFEADLAQPYTLSPAERVAVGERQTPTLRAGEVVLNQNIALPDRFTERTQGVATIFAKDGDDFVRITTSVKDAAGNRAMGTLLARDSAAYAKVSKGETYSGPATLFGTFYMTTYRPMKDASGAVIGVLFVGVDIGATTTALKQDVARRKVAQTGDYRVVSGAAGPAHGQYLVPENLLQKSALTGPDALVDDAGKALVPGMLSARDGTFTTGLRGEPRIVAHAYMPEWQWLVVGQASVAELTADVRRARLLYVGAALVAIAGLTLLLFFMIRRTVGRRLNAAMAVAEKLAQGDLRARADIGRPDEIGRLTAAVNGIGDGLIAIVQRVRAASTTMGVQTQEIANASADMSSQSESQAANVEETVASLEQLTATVAQNASNSDQVDEQVRHAARAADEGAVVVDTLVEAMDGVRIAADKMSEIIAVIHSIAFQTNILALNAAVEAARAGEEGRGFAVVASEVRQLAQRSGDAAKVIEGLIHTALEQVGAGHRHAGETRLAIAGIAGQVREVAVLVNDISTAGREQSAGIAQINSAVAHIGDMTQRNAALADEAARIASSLADLAGQLDESVGVFQT